MPITYGAAMADDAKNEPQKAAQPSAPAKATEKPPAKPAMAEPAAPDLDHEQGPAAQQLHPQLQASED